MNPRTTTLWGYQPDRGVHPPLARDLEVDIVVIGAGITGLTAALRLAEAGKRVAVLEARTAGSGVTVGSTAHVTEAVDARYTNVESTFGKEASRQVATASRLAMDHIAHRIASASIECDLATVPGYLYTERREDRDFLAAELEAARRSGLRVELCDVPGLPFPTVGAIRFPDQLRIDPRDYTNGILREALARGVRVFENTRAVEVLDNEPVEVRTDGGFWVRASAAFCATHVPLNRILLHTKLGHYQSYVAAFRGRSIDDALYWDTADPYHYLRMATIRGERFLVVGGEDHKTGTEDHTAISFERLLVYARERFGTDRPEHHWSAQVVEPIDGLPYIGRNAASKHVYTATGFSGNGITFGTFAALLVSDLILGIDNPWVDLFHATRVTASALGAFLKENKDIPAHLVGDRFAPPEVTSLDQIERDQGRTMKVDGQHLAVYRDGCGVVHAVSAVCTHMGCLVKFNEAERTWDCPCHGSRFGVDGRVIDGPAVTDLAKCTAKLKP